MSLCALSASGNEVKGVVNVVESCRNTISRGDIPESNEGILSCGTKTRLEDDACWATGTVPRWREKKILSAN
jgi:hypothetical protein